MLRWRWQQCRYRGFGNLRMEGIVTGGIMPLVPGLAFVNAIRDLADSDYLAGTVKMIDAVMVFVYIAIGVGQLWRFIIMCWEAFCDGHKNCSKSGVFVYRDDSICGHVPGAQKILYRMWNYGIGGLDDI